VKTFFAEAGVSPEHKVAVDSVPFGEGESVAIFMLAIAKGPEGKEPTSLQGSVLLYDDPLHAVSGDDWEADA
jgi:hypothetical protein